MNCSFRFANILSFFEMLLVKTEILENLPKSLSYVFSYETQ